MPVKWMNNLAGIIQMPNLAIKVLSLWLGMSTCCFLNKSTSYLKSVLGACLECWVLTDIHIHMNMQYILLRVHELRCLLYCWIFSWSVIPHVINFTTNISNCRWSSGWHWAWPVPCIYFWMRLFFSVFIAWTHDSTASCWWFAEN